MTRCNFVTTRDEFDESTTDACLFVSTSQMPSLQVRAKLLTGRLREQLGDHGFDEAIGIIGQLINVNISYVTQMPDFERHVLLKGHYMSVERAANAMVWLINIGAPSFSRHSLRNNLSIHIQGQMHLIYDEWRLHPEVHARAIKDGSTMLPARPELSALNPAFTPRRLLRPLDRLVDNDFSVADNGPMDRAMQEFSSPPQLVDGEPTKLSFSFQKTKSDRSPYAQVLLFKRGDEDSDEIEDVDDDQYYPRARKRGRDGSLKRLRTLQVDSDELGSGLSSTRSSTSTVSVDLM